MNVESHTMTTLCVCVRVLGAGRPLLCHNIKLQKQRLDADATFIEFIIKFKQAALPPLPPLAISLFACVCDTQSAHNKKYSMLFGGHTK